MVFTKIFRWLIGGILGISLLSCEAYRTLSVEVLQPASFQIAQGEKIALLERNIRKESRVFDFMKRNPLLDREYLFENFCEGVKFTFENSGYSDSIVSLREQAITNWDESFNPLPYPRDSMMNVCRNFGVDYILVIELQYYTPTDAPNALAATWFTRLYDKKQGIPVDSAKIDITIGNDYFDEFGDLITCIQGSFWDAGACAAQRLVPSWQEARRRVYVDGKVLRLGDRFFRKGDIDEAFNIWSGALNLSPKIAIQAGINMGWLYENAGDYELAEGILLECQSLAEANKLTGEEVNYLKDYLKTIQQRIEKVKILDQQIIPVENEEGR